MEINRINPIQPGFLPNAVKLPRNIKVGDKVTLKEMIDGVSGLTGKTISEPAQAGLTVTKVYRCGNHWRITAERGKYGDGYKQFDAIHTKFIKE